MFEKKLGISSDIDLDDLFSYFLHIKKEKWLERVKEQSDILLKDTVNKRLSFQAYFNNRLFNEFTIWVKRNIRSLELSNNEKRIKRIKKED